MGASEQVWAWETVFFYQGEDIRKGAELDMNVPGDFRDVANHTKADTFNLQLRRAPYFVPRVEHP